METFPEDMAAVRDAGHEIGLHGYSHENPVDMTIEQQRDILDKTYRMLTDFAGKPPRGSVAPWYANVLETSSYNTNEYAGGRLARRVLSCYSRMGSSMTTA